jgi:SAM-dependent methyltransferase
MRPWRPGLWLARALSANLISVDYSATAIELTASRAPAFLELGRGSFRVGTFDATGLHDRAADGVVSVDALPFSPDRDSSLREVRRILAPGGRVVFTANQHVDKSSDAPNSWEQQLARARPGPVCASSIGFGIHTAVTTGPTSTRSGLRTPTASAKNWVTSSPTSC